MVNQESGSEVRDYTVNIDYKSSYENNFGINVKRAVKFVVDHKLDCFPPCSMTGFILLPQALNPFLRAMEAMGESKNIVVVPAFEGNDPAYLILILEELYYIKGLEFTS